MNSIAALPTTRCSASPPSAPGDRSRTISPPNQPAQSRNSAAHTGAGTGSPTGEYIAAMPSPIAA